MSDTDTDARTPPRKVRVAVIGIEGTGKRTIIERLIGRARGLTSYVREWDSNETYDYQQSLPNGIGGEPVTIEWQWRPIPFSSILLPEKLRTFASSSQDVRLTEHVFEVGAEWLIKECEVCVLVYSVTDRHSFESLTKIWHEVWFKQLHRPAPVPSLDNYGYSKTPIICKQVWVVASMVDIPNPTWEISLARGKKYANHIGAQFRTMSGKTGEGCEGFGYDVAATLMTAEGRVWDLSRTEEEVPLAKSFKERLMARMPLWLKRPS